MAPTHFMLRYGLEQYLPQVQPIDLGSITTFGETNRGLPILVDKMHACRLPASILFEFFK